MNTEFIPLMMRRNRETIKLIEENKQKNGMKPMVYKNIERYAEIIASGVYKGVTYVVINRGIHPCAYVMCNDQEFIDRHKTEYDDLDCIDVHGGVTFLGDAKKLLGLEGYDCPCFGWDYGHAGDWAGYWTEEDNIIYGCRKYTTEILVDDCKDAIDQYLTQKERDNLR